MQGVAPLRGRRPPATAPRRQAQHPAGAGAAAGAAPAPPTPATPPQADRHSAPFAGIDRATAERVKRGRYPISGRLDLHGLTQEEAYRALSEFVAGSRAAGKRCLLIITGHGRMSGGILRYAVPRWLAEPRLKKDVLATAPARPQHGASGALYVLLRRDRV